MNFCLIVFTSFATAKRVKGLLQKKYNIYSEIMQTPAGVNAKGCSYSLKIRVNDIDTVWDFVKANGLSSKGVFSLGNYAKLK